LLVSTAAGVVLLNEADLLFMDGLPGQHQQNATLQLPAYLSANDDLQISGPIYKISQYNLLIVCDNAKVTIDLQQTSNLQNISRRISSGTIYLQNRKMVRDSVHKSAYDISKRNLSTL